jgi:heterotetrameric sarcosine oxidase gamma subunit
MTNVQSALSRYRQPGRTGASGKAGIILGEVTAKTVLQFAAWPETLSKMGKLASKSAGVKSAPGISRLARGGAASLMRVEPLKWWLVMPQALADMPKTDADTGAVLDLSDARTWITIKGAAAENLLSHFLPIDWRPNHFGDDHVASSAMHHVGVTVWRGDDGFNMLVPRSFAGSIWQMLEDSARQYGLKVE